MTWLEELTSDMKSEKGKGTPIASFILVVQGGAQKFQYHSSVVSGIKLFDSRLTMDEIS